MIPDGGDAMIRNGNDISGRFQRLAETAAAQSARPPQVVRAVLRVDPPVLPPISRLDARPADLALLGRGWPFRTTTPPAASWARDFEAVEVAATPDTAAAELEKAADGTFPSSSCWRTSCGRRWPWPIRPATRRDDPERAGADDNLRGTDCRANTVHVAPSHAMLTDALAQFLMWKRWPIDWFLIAGSHPQDVALADAYRRAVAVKFGATSSRNAPMRIPVAAGAPIPAMLVQAQMPVFTQRAAEHDVLIAADEAGSSRRLPYQTWDARPVAGSAGWCRSWHPALEAWGATQFQNRFEALAVRPMREEDYQTWLALRMIGEAATAHAKRRSREAARFLLSPASRSWASRARKLTLRDWDHQLRQPILLTTGVRSRPLVSPRDQYLHQSSALGYAGHRPP